MDERTDNPNPIKTYANMHSTLSVPDKSTSMLFRLNLQPLFAEPQPQERPSRILKHYANAQHSLFFSEKNGK